MAAIDSLPSWLDAVRGAPVPDGVAAYRLNFYQTWNVYELELVDADAFNREDSDCACSELFASRNRNGFLRSRMVAVGFVDGAVRIVQGASA